MQQRPTKNWFDTTRQDVKAIGMTWEELQQNGVESIATCVSQKTHYVSQTNGPLRLIWHNFTNSRQLLIIFGTKDAIHFSVK